MRSIVRVTAFLLLFGLICMPVGAWEGETLYDREYCFSEENFEEDVCGVLVRSVPDRAVGVFCLENRVICPGDVLPADRLSQLRMVPVCSENCEAVLCYRPIFDGTLGEEASLVVKIRSGKNEAPKVESMELETYKNIANNGKLLGVDPEGAALEFALAEEPKYGKVELKKDGSFLYIPGKNKEGEDRVWV